MLSRMMIVKTIKGLVPDAHIEQGVNGEEAVSKVSAAQKSGEQYDFLFIDCMMPIKDGLEALKDIREFEKELTVVMITANIQEKVREQALALGCAAFVSKSGSDEEIRQMLCEGE